MSRRHISVRLFTFDNHPPQHLWNHYQIWVGGLARGKGHFVIKPETRDVDSLMRLTFKEVEGYTDNQIEDIMNFIYTKL